MAIFPFPIPSVRFIFHFYIIIHLNLISFCNLNYVVVVFFIIIMLVLLIDCHINHVSKIIVSRTKSLSNIHRITIHVCQGVELNKLCFRSDPFLHSPIYPFVLKCYMYFLKYNMFKPMLFFICCSSWPLFNDSTF